jgi:hypothetical protein
MKIGEIDFNQAHANKVSEKQFIEDHEHHKDDVDLKEAYKTLRAKPPKEDKTKEAEAAGPAA